VGDVFGADGIDAAKCTDGVADFTDRPRNLFYA